MIFNAWGLSDSKSNQKRPKAGRDCVRDVISGNGILSPVPLVQSLEFDRDGAPRMTDNDGWVGWRMTVAGWQATNCSADTRRYNVARRSRSAELPRPIVTNTSLRNRVGIYQGNLVRIRWLTSYCWEATDSRPSWLTCLLSDPLTLWNLW